MSLVVLWGAVTELLEHIGVHVGLVESWPFDAVLNFKVGFREGGVVTLDRVHHRIIEDLTDVVQAQRGHVRRQLGGLREIGTGLAQHARQDNVEDTDADIADNGDRVGCRGNVRSQACCQSADSRHDDDRSTGVLRGDA